MMDTLVSVTVHAPPEVAEKGLAEAFAAFAAIDSLASFHRADSELTRLNRERRLRPSTHMAALLQAASETWAQTGGVFDPTFAELHRIYGFYDKVGRQPTDTELADTLQKVGWGRQVASIDGEILLASQTMVDLGGIAGGFGIEAAAAALRAASCPVFFIDDGGDLWMEGRKANGHPWRVLVKDPRRPGGVLARVETFGPAAISTSGDYERFVEVAGRRINHIMDPHSGRPAEFYRSVTVVASTPLAADVFSTTLFALPPEEARAFAERHSLPALFLPATGTPWMTRHGEGWFQDVAP